MQIARVCKSHKFLKIIHPHGSYDAVA